MSSFLFFSKNPLCSASDSQNVFTHFRHFYRVICDCAKNDNEVDLSRLSTVRFISYLVDNYRFVLNENSNYNCSVSSRLNLCFLIFISLWSSLGDLFHFNSAVFLYSSFIDDMKEVCFVKFMFVI